jgi:hypothetical protein
MHYRLCYAISGSAPAVMCAPAAVFDTAFGHGSYMGNKNRYGLRLTFATLDLNRGRVTVVRPVCRSGHTGPCGVWLLAGQVQTGNHTSWHNVRLHVCSDCSRTAQQVCSLSSGGARRACGRRWLTSISRCSKTVMPDGRRVLRGFGISMDMRGKVNKGHTYMALT